MQGGGKCDYIEGGSLGPPDPVFIRDLGMVHPSFSVTTDKLDPFLMPDDTLSPDRPIWPLDGKGLKCNTLSLS